VIWLLAGLVLGLLIVVFLEAQKRVELSSVSETLCRRVAALEEKTRPRVQVKYQDPVLAGGVPPEGPVAPDASPNLNRMPRPRTMRDVTATYERKSRRQAAAAAKADEPE
jgi:hypothetical protein